MSYDQWRSSTGPRRGDHADNSHDKCHRCHGYRWDICSTLLGRVLVSIDYRPQDLFNLARRCLWLTIRYGDEMRAWIDVGYPAGDEM